MNVKYDRQWLQDTASDLNCNTSNNIPLVNSILEGLNKLDGSCPCVPSYLQSEDTKCPCKAMTTIRVCKCGIFTKEA